MKPVVVAGVLLVLAGTASAGWFALPFDSLRTKTADAGPPDAGPPDAGRPGASAIAPTGRPPVPYVPSPKAPIAARFASLTEPTPDQSQSTMQPDNSAKLAIERDADQYVRDLMSSDGPCKGRLPRSIIIEGNGKVSVRC